MESYKNIPTSATLAHGGDQICFLKIELEISTYKANVFAYRVLINKSLTSPGE